MDSCNILYETYNQNSEKETDEVIHQIKKMKAYMSELWEEKGRTDQEILDVSVKIDELLVKYYRLVIKYSKTQV